MTVTLDRATGTAGLTGATLHLDLAAVAHNTRYLRARSTSLMAFVKADGFNHGASQIARTALANGADRLGVTSLAEAHELRDAGLRAPILSWLNPPQAEWADAIRRRIALAVPSLDHLDAISRAALKQNQPALIHLQADVGMARDGAAPADWAELTRRAERAEQTGLVQVVGLMGHLANAANGPDELGRRRYERFLATAADAGLRNRPRHLAATAATLTDPDSLYDFSRIGAGLYGIEDGHDRTTQLHWALNLSAPVVSVRDVDAGVGIGYRHTHLTATPTRLATLPLGYADGLPRAASGRAEVFLHGRRCPIIGLVSMDQVVVDAGDSPVTVGETATIFGPGDHGEPTPDDWAAWSDTIPHEILTGLGHRLIRTVRTETSTETAANKEQA